MFIRDTWQRLVCHFFVLTMHIFDGICERNHISVINRCIFWPVPIVLVSKTERNSQGHDSSGVMKKRVRLGSGREMKLISQHNPQPPSPSPLSLLCYSRAVQFGTAFYQLNARNSLCVFSHTNMLLFRCLQFVPR